jgi:hypothetical protein
MRFAVTTTFSFVLTLLCSSAGCVLETGDAGVRGGDEAELGEAEPSALAPGFVGGVNVHNYPKPTSYGYLASDGGDRMGNAITTLGVRYVRGALIGDVTFLARLASFGVTHALLTLDAKSYGKPFDSAKLRTALRASVTEAKRLGLTVIAEGLNEWDLFRSKSYNAGVVPAGMSATAFIAHTQKSLYEAAHALGIAVLGPSVGHPHDAASLALFPDVSAHVDIVNMHMYFSTTPETLPIPQYVANHQRYQGTGKPVWVTETGISAYNGVTLAQQADVIARGFTAFANSGLVAAAFQYELLNTDRAGWRGFTYVWDSAELHFGLFNYYGQAYPAATAFKTFLASH